MVVTNNSPFSGRAKNYQPTGGLVAAAKRSWSNQMKTWNVAVTRQKQTFHLGQVQENTEALARCAALAKYGVADDDEFFEVREGVPGDVLGIKSGDEFEVSPA